MQISALLRITTIRVVILFLVAMTVISGSPAPAYSAEDDAITWSVRPADADAPDGRAWVEQSLGAGDQRTDHLAIRNFSSREVRFSLSAGDGFFTLNGRFDMTPSGEPSTDAGTWIVIADAVTVGPRSTVVVPFTTRVPANAEPGDHAAGVTASITTRSAEQAGGPAVGIESRMGFRVMTRVTGEITPALAVDAIESSFSPTWNPLRPGAATVTVLTRNTGNVRIIVDGDVTVAGRTVPLRDADDPPQELLPGETRALTVHIQRVWPTVLVAGAVDLRPTAIMVDDSVAALTVERQEFAIWAVPISQLLLLAGVALILIGIVTRRRRGRRRLEQLLARARAEGVASVRPGTSGRD